MEQSASILMTSVHGVADGNFRMETQVRSAFAAIGIPKPTAPRRAILRAQVSCAALIFAALAITAAYILIPLAMAVHIAVHPVLLSVVIAAAVLTELALIVTFIVLKTEGTSE